MDKAAKLRWSVLTTAMAATVTAIFYPVEQELVSWQPSRSVPMPPKATPTSLATTEQPSTPWIATDTDPFAPRSWVAPPPEPAPAVATAVVDSALESSSEPAPPPPLPYKFVGQMRDGSDTVVYLSLGEQMILARSGETLEGGYKVAAITGSQIDFESVALGVRQSLPIPNQE